MFAKEENAKFNYRGRIFNFRPLFFSAVFLALGILFAYFQKINGVSAWWLCFLLPVCIAPFFFCKKKDRALLAILVLLLCFAIGNISFSIVFTNYQSTTVYDGEISIVGRVVDIGQKGEYFALTLDSLFLDGNGESAKLIAYLPYAYAQNIRLADELLLFGSVNVKEGYSPLNGLYAGWIADNVCYSADYIRNVTVTGSKFDLFLYLRQSMTDVIESGMDDGAAALTKAILLGNTLGVEVDVLQNVRYGGIAHVFAVSGLHVGSLFAFCCFIAKKCRFPKWLSFVVVFFVLLAYGGICGYSSSVIRSIVTCLCFYLAKEIGIKADFLEIIGLAAMAVLLIFPTLLFDVGFQLSYGACIGLSCFSKPFYQAMTRAFLYVKHKKADSDFKDIYNQPASLGDKAISVLAQAVASTLAAQTFTLPITVNTFGYLSLLSIPLNCLVVPALVALFPVLLALTAVGCVLPVAAPYLLYLPAVVWHAIILPFEIFDLSTTALLGIFFSGGAALLYCTALVLISGKINLRGWKKWTMVGVYLVLFVAAMLIGKG